MRALLDSHGITQAQLGEALGMTGPAISRKLAGLRAWKLVEIQRALEFLSVRLERPVTYEEVFGVERLADVPCSDATGSAAPAAPGARRRRRAKAD
jgi:transcriptional regulator with XRE-family HTH domain